MTDHPLHTIYPATFRLCPAKGWQQLTGDLAWQELPERLAELDPPGPRYLADLARLERAIHEAGQFPALPASPAALMVNPTLALLDVAWSGLPALLTDAAPPPRPVASLVLVWRPPDRDTVSCRQAVSRDLLALKIVTEDLDPAQIARQQGLTPGMLDTLLDQAVRQGLLLRPASKIRRPANRFTLPAAADPAFLTASIFTLQWHITQHCDLHCRHCYDRSNRTALSLDQALAVLDDLHRFCRDHHVRGQVSFTGGNPLLYPDFPTLYQAAADHGFLLAILGNPTTAAVLDQLLAIRTPEFYQVSLEGLQEHNDYIRGTGHFDRLLTFLDLLREKGIYSMVMLTLTRENVDQVLPLAALLGDRVDLFTFNRLTMFGEGANLAPVPPERFRSFLAAFQTATEDNPVLAPKDNLLNLLRDEQKLPLFGGCAGHGCGAAFNFLALLADGEVHACRKFPSPLGSIHHNTLGELYHSSAAKRYRRGSAACTDCRLAAVCRGCPAVVAGHGEDPFTALDPYCWRQVAGQK